jgi:hypothetical protein
MTTPAATIDAKGFLASLFDTRFTSYITPRVIRLLCTLVIVVTAIAGIGIAGVAIKLNVVAGIFVLLIVAPLCFFIPARD